MTAFRKIAVRGPNWLGDHVMAMPFYRALAEKYPSHHRVLYVPEAIRELPMEGLFHEVIGLDALERKSLAGMKRISNHISHMNFDRAWILPASFSAVFPFVLAGVPERVGFKNFETRFLLHEAKPWLGVSANRHKSDLYGDLLELTGETAPSPVVVSAEKRITIAPGASIALREWPYFGELLEQLTERFSDYEIAVVGGKTDERVFQMTKRISNPRVRSYLGQTTLPDLELLLQRSRLVIANDSGVAHVAATLARVPTLVLMGPGAPHYITPRGPSVRVVRDTHLACSPCESARCRAPFGYQECLKRISVNHVLTEVESILGNLVTA